MSDTAGKHEGLRVTLHHSQEVTDIGFSGAIDERALPVVQEAFGTLRHHVRICFRDVTRINSYGIGILMRQLGSITAHHKVEFTECGDVIVDQFLMLDFSQYGRIASFFARYVCQRCEAEDRFLLVVSRDLKIEGSSGSVRAPEFPCPCGGFFVVDDSLDFIVDHLDYSR